MNTKTHKTLIFFGLLSMFSAVLRAEINSKIDIAPAYIHIDVLESGHTVHKMDMAALRADNSIGIYKGVCLKPNFMIATGSKRGELFTAGIGIGHNTPLHKRLTVTPSVGVAYTFLRTVTDLKIKMLQLKLKDVKENFRSWSPYLALDVSIKIAEGWRVILVYQYSWSRTITTLKSSKLKPLMAKHVHRDKSHTQGSNYGLVLEKDIGAQWSVDLGIGYNNSLSKEKHGLRAYGVKAGVAYWF